jgi:phenylalanine-4-hydroxylase
MCCCTQGGAELVPFDPFAPQPKMSYKDGYQKRYFVLDSFEVSSFAKMV